MQKKRMGEEFNHTLSTFSVSVYNNLSLKCLSPNFFYLINEKYNLQIVELSKHIFV